LLVFVVVAGFWSDDELDPERLGVRALTPRMGLAVAGCARAALERLGRVLDTSHRERLVAWLPASGAQRLLAGLPFESSLRVLVEPLRLARFDYPSKEN